MSRILLSTLMILTTSHMTVQADGPAQPNSKAFGKSLTEWMQVYWEQNLTGNSADTPGRVLLMPLPASVPIAGSATLADPLILQGQLQASYSKGTPFVLPVVTWIGETYDPNLQIPDDMPLADAIFTESEVLITLNGQQIIDSANEDLSDFYFGPAFFDAPVLYSQPTDYGAVGATFVQGIGFAHRPLPPGEHVLQLTSEIKIPDYDLHVIFMNEWILTID